MEIRGGTAAEIAHWVRGGVDRGELPPGTALPPVRQLAERLGLNRNTVAAAYRALVTAGVAETRGRGGTVLRGYRAAAAEEGAARALPGGAIDVGSGNPRADLLPDPRPHLGPGARPALYGDPAILPELAELATRWLARDQPRPFRLSVTAGAVDAVERLLGASLAAGDRVALEDPCFLASMNAVRLAGYRPEPVPVDRHGMTAAGLAAALAAGARAVVCTPRAHNPTGASLSPARAAELRAVLAGHPGVLIIEDDHFSRLSAAPYASIIPAASERWALIRSVSKFFGPDLRLAAVASDPGTAERLAARLSPGTTWVSHLLQRAAAGLLASPDTDALIAAAGAGYRRVHEAFVAELAAVGIAAGVGDGLSVWVPVGADAERVAARLAGAGWLARSGAAFALTPGGESRRSLRLTVHELTAAERAELATALAAAIAAARASDGVDSLGE